MDRARSRQCPQLPPVDRWKHNITVRFKFCNFISKKKETEQNNLCIAGGDYFTVSETKEE